MLKIVQFQTIQFIISTLLSSSWPINWTLFGTTTPVQSGPGSDCYKGVLYIPQSSSITGVSPSDCLASYTGHSFGGGLTPLQRSSRCILQFLPSGPVYMFVQNEFVLSSPVIQGLSCSTFLNDKGEGMKVAIQLLFNGLLHMNAQLFSDLSNNLHSSALCR